MQERSREIPPVQHIRKSRQHLLPRRRPHHRRDHHQVQQQHRSLHYPVRPIMLPPGKNPAGHQRTRHPHLNRKVQVRGKRRARPQKSCAWNPHDRHNHKNQPDDFLFPRKLDLLIQPVAAPQQKRFENSLESRTPYKSSFLLAPLAPPMPSRNCSAHPAHPPGSERSETDVSSV